MDGRLGGRGRAGPAAVAAVVCWLAAAGARGGGFEYGANGAAAVGRAGAFVARGDNPSTLYYNVAGMGRMEEGTHVLLDVNLVLRTLSYQRAGTMDFAPGNGFAVNGLPFPEVSDRAGLHPAPFMAVVTDLGLGSDFVFGFGLFGPAAPGRADFPTQVTVTNNLGEPTLVPSPQRYDLVFVDILFVWPTLAAAWRVGDDLSWGLGFQSGFVNIVFQTTAVAATGRSAINDMRSHIDVRDSFVPAGLFGIWYRPLKYLELALSARVSDGIDASGDLITVSNPYGVDDQSPVASDRYDRYNAAAGEHAPRATLSFDWPALVVRTGFRFVWPRDAGGGVGEDADAERSIARLAPSRREWFDIELNVTYEMNSSVRDFRTKVTGVVPTTDPDLPPLPVRPTGDPATDGVLGMPHDWQDTVAVRLGGDVNFLEGDLSIRWGLLFETSTVPEDMTRLDYAQWETYGVSGGVTVRMPWWGLELTASYLRLFMPDRVVSLGGARVIAALAGDDADLPVINEGRYEGAMNIFAIGAGARF